MPSVSLAQNRYVHAAAARGEQWAIKWLRDQRGHKVPRVERVAPKKKVGRPRKPIAELTNHALWKRAQRADTRPPNKGMIRHHVDNAYGRRSPKTEYISRGEHNRRHRRRAVAAEVKRRRKRSVIA
ncbi:MAG TPA: hypothetical protein VF009_06975 [Solirubrobacterales bacterium]